MKKSMIISTIAMIVVVVVALSTATYAWLSSSAVTKAYGNVSVKASGIFTLAQGVGTPNAQGELTYTYESATDIQIPEDEGNSILSTLRAPNKNIGTMDFQLTVDGTKTSATLQKFIEAKNNDVNNLESGIYQKGADKYVTAAAVRVDNISGTQQTLKVSVVVKLGTDLSEADLRAASAIRFNFAFIHDTSSTGEVAKVWSNGYYYTAAETYTVAESNNKVLPSKTGDTKNTGTCTSGLALSDTTTAPSADTLVGEMNSQNYKIINKYNGTDNKALCEAAGVNTNEYYIVYTMAIANVASTDKVYAMFYTWLDGFVAGDQSSGCNFDLIFAFYQG